MFFALPQLRLRKNIFREVSENLTPNVITKDKCGKYAQKNCRPKAKKWGSGQSPPPPPPLPSRACTKKLKTYGSINHCAVPTKHHTHIMMRIYLSTFTPALIV